MRTVLTLTLVCVLATAAGADLVGHWTLDETVNPSGGTAGVRFLSCQNRSDLVELF